MKIKLVKFAYLLFFLLLLLSFWQKKSLPDKQEIDKRLLQAPVQASSTALTDFRFDYRKKSYTVQPIADYELWGLVVSVNDIKAWYNMYHDKDSVNLKDICVIWGDNLKSDAYQQVSFKSGEWTCYYRWFGQLNGAFHGNQLSNNHLFSDKEKVRDTIRQMQIGDQVHIRGVLSRYAENDSSNYRGTSLSRDDSGNGACETIYVKEAKIIKKRFPDWELLKIFSLYSLFALLVLDIWLFLRAARIRRQNRPS